MSTQSRVFISYRRDDTKWVAGRLYDRLAAVLGESCVFLDVTNIEPGRDFIQVIEEVIGACEVLLVLVGHSWLSASAGAGKLRIEDERDLMRIEISTALKRNIRVIPILVDGATLPEPGKLPAELSGLARRNARQMHFETFHSDVDSFIRVLERILAGPTAPPQTVTEAGKPKAQADLSSIATNLPFTVSLETLGGVATPLLRKATALPAEATEVFSTGADNQTSVEVRLFAGERSKTSENVPLGVFQLRDIPQAPRGVPQIRLRATVDPSLILVVSAEDLGTGRKEVLDVVDLSKIRLPDSATLPDKPKSSLDAELELTISKVEAASGSEREVKTPAGSITIRVPPEVKPGTKLRVREQGYEDGGKRGDLYIAISISG